MGSGDSAVLARPVPGQDGACPSVSQCRSQCLAAPGSSAQRGLRLRLARATGGGGGALLGDPGQERAEARGADYPRRSLCTCPGKGLPQASAHCVEEGSSV